jgi:glycosyltransferase involved in cell wall biosynthesis
MLATPAVSWEILRRGGRRQLVTQPRLLLAAMAGAATGLLLAGRELLRPRRSPSRPVSRSRTVLVAHPGAELYGSDRMLAESVSGLIAEGSRVVVALPAAGPLVAELEVRGAEVRVCRMPVLRKSALSPRGAAALLADCLRGLPEAVRLLRVTGARTVYVSTITLPVWPVLARFMRRRVVLHVHEAESGAARVVRRLLAAPARFAHVVLVNSRYSRDVLLESTPWAAGRTVVVDNGVAGPAHPVPPRPEIAGPLRLVYVGRLSPRKGPQVAVAALAELARRGVDARLRLVGSVFPGYEWFEADLRRQVDRAGLTGRVEFAGFIPDIWAELHEADAVLVPSVLDEPFGNTAVEAVLAGRPVVVSATSGLVEAAAGYASAQTVPPGDAPAWADALQRVVADWPSLRGAAVRDAAVARRRHAPERYRSRVAELTLAAVDPGCSE